MPHKGSRKNSRLEEPLLGQMGRPPGYQSGVRSPLLHQGIIPPFRPSGPIQSNYPEHFRNGPPVFQPLISSPRNSLPSPFFKSSSPKSYSKHDVLGPKFAGQPPPNCYSECNSKNAENNIKQNKIRIKKNYKVECSSRKSGSERTVNEKNDIQNHKVAKDQPQSVHSNNKNKIYLNDTEPTLKPSDCISFMEQATNGRQLNNEDKEMMKIFSEEAFGEASRKVRKEKFDPSEEISQYLAGKYLVPVRSSRFIWARWYCQLCDYHYANLKVCWEHLHSSRHLSLMRSRALETTLSRLPKPSSDHLETIENCLTRIVDEHGMSEAERKEREKVALDVHNLLHSHLKGCNVQYFGSTLSGFALKSSDLNLDLNIDEDQQPHLALIISLEILQQSLGFLNVVDNFSARVPSIRFETTSGITVNLSLNNCNARQTCLLLADYLALDPRVRILGIAFRVWASIVKLDNQMEGGLPPHTFIIMLVFFLQKTGNPVLPCIHDWLDEEQGVNYISPVDQLARWRSQNTQSPAELWVDLFSFLSIELKSKETIVSLRKMNTTMEEKQSKGKRLAVEDPYSGKRSLCRSFNSLFMFNYMENCFKSSFLYFGTVQTSLGPVITEIVDNGEDTDVETDPAWTLVSWLEKKGTKLTEIGAATVTCMVPKDMISFNFDQCNLSYGLPPPPSCSACGQEGHLSKDCPEELQLALPPLPNLPVAYIRLLDMVCETSAQDLQPSEQEISDKDYLMADLRKYIKKFWPNAELSLFGSSANGFAFRHSDIDICLTFKGMESTEDIDCTALIEELADKVKRMIGVKNVIAVTSAKVPIVKLFHQQCRRDADISLYNVLARENTRMLACYASIDHRVRVLGYMAKLFAKVCGIGDASRGSLSSYAYTLMMIFYLQQCNPPVIPVLQELYPSGQVKPENQVDGWNAWFQDNPNIMSSLWTGHGHNIQSVGELWVGYLDFYAGGWDDKRLVVSIKHTRPLTKFEKMWNGLCIAIEDPFELGHNLGSGLSRKMYLFIKKSFMKGRKLFGVPFKNNPMGYTRIQDYFFDRSLLTEGAPPNDRNCRICGRFGHFAASCPTSKKGDTLDKKKRENHNKEPPVGVKKEDIILEPEVGIEDKKQLGYLGRERRKVGDLALSISRSVKLLDQRTIERQKDIEEFESVKYLSDGTQHIEDDEQLKESIDLSILYDIPTSRARIVSRKELEDCEDVFNYNDLKPHSVSAGSIDYLNPVVLENRNAELEFSDQLAEISELPDGDLFSDPPGINFTLDFDKDLSSPVADDNLTAYFSAEDTMTEYAGEKNTVNLSGGESTIGLVGEAVVLDVIDENNIVIGVSSYDIEADIENKLKHLRMTDSPCLDSTVGIESVVLDAAEGRGIVKMRNERRYVKSKENIKQKK